MDKCREHARAFVENHGLTLKKTSKREWRKVFKPINKAIEELKSKYELISMKNVFNKHLER